MTTYLGFQKHSGVRRKYLIEIALVISVRVVCLWGFYSEVLKKTEGF
ncbi:hypothetical protein [Marinobacter salexigens]|uniref:Uncharacterized protein n=1 Tax=Marinobacter salexigens TaxID=1925763 RepID=A0ABS6A9V6_9GAMM|nr:hypothetical protein [Marinobacter salexigens]MBU2874874.1 hypothetical protein [Marinobacter salexigens]